MDSSHNQGNDQTSGLNEVQLLEKWNKEKISYKAWGRYIQESICNGLMSYVPKDSLNTFFRIPISIRLKEDKSLIDKAFFRSDKHYNNPYEQITDKVGMRFVVLLNSEIDILKKCVEESSLWEWPLDKDFEKERADNPNYFDYQSMHYVVRSKHGFSYNDIYIEANTPCEIQIRTLLQHANSELTHDTIYKPKKTADTKIKRTIAKSTALIETCDNFFDEVMKTLGPSENEKKLISKICELYNNKIGEKGVIYKSTFTIIDSFFEYISGDIVDKITQYCNSKTFIYNIIIDKRKHNLLYEQPIVLFIYYMVGSYPIITKNLWPFTIDAIASVFSDLGISLDSIN